jgi:hypothetical protein
MAQTPKSLSTGTISELSDKIHVHNIRQAGEPNAEQDDSRSDLTGSVHDKPVKILISSSRNY